MQQKKRPSEFLLKVSEGWRLPTLSTAHAGCASRPSVTHGLQRASDDAFGRVGSKKKDLQSFLIEGPQGWRLPTLPLGIAVPSALTGLTSLFGMGRGGSPSLLPPFIFLVFALAMVVLSRLPTRIWCKREKKY